VLILGLYVDATGIVAASAIMFQSHEVHAAKQAVFKETCRVIHSKALAYRQDIGTAPHSAEDLIAEGYLKALPRDISIGGCL
jgi:hypothetical protein